MINKEINDNFDRELCGELRNLVNSTNVFWEDKLEKPYYNHLCAMMDRVDESMGYIFNHTSTPKTNDELVLFLLHTCIVRDSVKKVMDILKTEPSYDQIVKEMPGYLSSIQNQAPFNDTIKLSDDLLFNYLRSISFAHPLDTNKGHVVNKVLHADHCSPFVMLDRGLCYKDNVGVYVYSNAENSIFSIQLPYSDLLNYAYSRYSLIKYIIEELSRRLKNKEETWRQHKVNREQAPELILKDIKSILEERYEYACDIDELISLLTCNYTRPENQRYVTLVQEEFIKRIPDICNAIDDMDTEAAYQTYKDILFSRPEEMYQGADYELEKIFCCLNNDSRYGDQMFGKMMAKSFTKGFASKWVVMDIDNMSFEEIQMLTRIACFMEKREQDKQKTQKTGSK